MYMVEFQSGMPISLILYQGSNEIIAKNIFFHLKEMIAENKPIPLKNTNWYIVGTQETEFQLVEDPEAIGLFRTIDYKVILRGILDERSSEK